jgi:hypothetical protein
MSCLTNTSRIISRYLEFYLHWTVAPSVFQITPRHGPRRKQPLCCCRRVFTALLHSNGRGGDHLENSVLLLCACMLWAFPSNGCCLQSNSLATNLYATIFWKRTVEWMRTKNTNKETYLLTWWNSLFKHWIVVYCWPHFLPAQMQALCC